MTFSPAKGPRQRSLSLLLTLIVLGLALVPGTVRQAHASTTGLICLADVASSPSPPANPCPKPPFFNGPVTSPDQQLRIGVFAYNSSGLSAFDVVLLTDHTLLKPAGVDLTGSVLLAPTVVLVECLSGILVSGSTCPTNDTVDTLDFSAVSLSGQNTPTPTTGLLFTAIYNITGTTSASGISIVYQTGCSTSSDGTYCVTIANGTPFEVPETIQGATFNNNTPPPYLTVSANSTTIGPIAVHNFASLQLNLTGQNGWNNEGCPCAVALSTIANTSLTVRLNTTSVNAPPTGSVYASLNVTASTGGNFSLTVYAQYPSLDLNNFNSSTLVAHVTVTVLVSDFALSANPAASTLLVGLAGSTVITATGENGFTGPVQLSVASTAGQCNLSPTTATVPGSETSQLTCTSTSAGNFTATVTGRNVLDSHTVQVNFVVQDFTISLSSSQLTVQAGSSQTFLQSSMRS